METLEITEVLYTTMRLLTEVPTRANSSNDYYITIEYLRIGYTLVLATFGVRYWVGTLVFININILCKCCKTVSSSCDEDGAYVGTEVDDALCDVEVEETLLGGALSRGAVNLDAVGVIARFERDIGLGAGECAFMGEGVYLPSGDVTLGQVQVTCELAFLLTTICVTCPGV